MSQNRKVHVVEVAEGEEHIVLFVPKGGTRQDKYGSVVIADSALSRVSAILAAQAHPDNGSACYTAPVSVETFSEVMANNQAALFDPETFLYALGEYIDHYVWRARQKAALKRVQRLIESLDTDRLVAVKAVLVARFGDVSGGDVALKDFAARAWDLFTDLRDEDEEDDEESPVFADIQSLLAALPPEADQSQPEPEPEPALIDVLDLLIEADVTPHVYLKGYFTCKVYGCKRHADNGKGFGSGGVRLGKAGNVSLKLARHVIRKHEGETGGLTPEQITAVRVIYGELHDAVLEASEDMDDEDKGMPPAKPKKAKRG